MKIIVRDIKVDTGRRLQVGKWLNMAVPSRPSRSLNDPITKGLVLRLPFSQVHERTRSLLCVICVITLYILPIPGKETSLGFLFHCTLYLQLYDC